MTTDLVAGTAMPPTTSATQSPRQILEQGRLQHRVSLQHPANASSRLAQDPIAYLSQTSTSNKGNRAYEQPKIKFRLPNVLIGWTSVFLATLGVASISVQVVIVKHCTINDLSLHRC
jgi:hypothetical protein